ncbi:uncharacterized protein LOC141601251 [Silene latifolia]|uniref:uncharacterized protein LOC141601251 n=1 Tax=Silene latifolia TaxID=37657 RepID=UPI003D785038
MEIEEWEREDTGYLQEDETLVLEEVEAERETDQGQVMAHPDTGHSLVLWRVMHSQPAPLEADQSSMIFKRRPWEFDRNTTHQGKENVYSFKRNGKKVTLTPLPPNQRGCGSPNMPEEVNGVLFLSEAAMIKELKQEQPKYNEVFPAELPSGLPPLRGIEHHIDLVPGFVLPNRPTYRCDPTSTKELQHQIEELMTKGFVRESLSPYAVPALLVPKKDGTWRMSTDSRAINNITVNYRFPIPRLDNMLDELSAAQIFSKIDLRQGYRK